MGIGTFGAFTQARLAIYAAQTGITVTGNNISNINTTGYTRQRLEQVSLNVSGSDRYVGPGNVRAGQGVLVKSISQIRSPYLDIRFRDLNAKVGFYDARMEGLDSIARILDEVGTGDVSKGEGGYGVLGLDIQKLYTALGNITDQTGHQEYDDTVKGVAASLVNRLRSYAGRLEEVRDEYDTMLKENLEKANGILDNIRTLNEEIRKSEIYGNPALELRDERNNEIDSLSELMDINVVYSEEEIAPGVTVEKLSIRLGNANPDDLVESDESLLVDGVYSAHLIFGKPMLNDAYDEKALPYLNDAGAPTEDEFATDGVTPNQPNPAAQKYIKKTQKADGTFEETEVSDIRDATIITDESANPNYDMMITELRDKTGKLNYENTSYAAAAVDVADVPFHDPAFKFDEKTNRAMVQTAGEPDKGDTTILVYTRKVIDRKGDLNDPKNYSYTVQKYEQIVSKPVVLDDNDLDGKIQAQREFLTEEGVFIPQSTVEGVDEQAAGKRGIKYYQKALDLLANQLANTLNEANQGFLRDPNGNYLAAVVDANGDPVMDANGKYAKGEPIEITDGADKYRLNVNSDWVRDVPDGIKTMLLGQTGLAGKTPDDLKKAGISTQNIIDAYLKGQTYNEGKKQFEPLNKDDIKNPDGTVLKGWNGDGQNPPMKKLGAQFIGGPLFSNGNNSNDMTDITALNINISETWEHSPVLVRSFDCIEGTTVVASGDSANLRHLEYLVSYGKHEFIPNHLASSPEGSEKALFTGTFFDMWNDIGGTLGQDQTEASTNLDAYYQNALSVDTDRDSVSSVDFNDEAMNLMTYSKSYNAACRLMTTIDSMLDKLINGTGMTT